MAQKFLTNIDLNQNQLINAKFEVLATAPSSGNFEGRMYFNSTTDSIEVYGNGAWRKVVNSISSGGGAGIAEALTVSESNGTVTLTLNVADTDSAGLLPAAMWNMLTDATDAATVSKLVKRDANGNAKVATPTDDAHIATQAYVDAARSGLDVKASVRVATTAAINLSTDLEADDIIDGVIKILNAPSPIPVPVHSGLMNPPYRLFNIGNNSPVKLTYFIELIEKELGKKALKVMLPMQQGDVYETYADISSLEKFVCYKPSTKIEAGVHKFVSWFLSYYN